MHKKRNDEEERNDDKEGQILLDAFSFVLRHDVGSRRTSRADVGIL